MVTIFLYAMRLHLICLRVVVDEIDEEMATTIVVGHYHKQWNRIWMDKQLIMSGSCGWPQTGRIEVIENLLRKGHYGV